MQRNDDELPRAVVAAIVAALAALAEDDEPDASPCFNWQNSTRVASRWRATGPTCWRDVERGKGWAP